MASGDNHSFQGFRSTASNFQPNSQNDNSTEQQQLPNQTPFFSHQPYQQQQQQQQQPQSYHHDPNYVAGHLQSYNNQPIYGYQQPHYSHQQPQSYHQSQHQYNSNPYIQPYGSQYHQQQLYYNQQQPNLAYKNTQASYNRHQRQQQAAPESWDDEHQPNRQSNQQKTTSSTAAATVNASNSVSINSNGSKTLSLSSSTRPKPASSSNDNKPGVISISIGKKKDTTANTGASSKVLNEPKNFQSTQPPNRSQAATPSASQKKVISIASTTSSSAASSKPGTPPVPSDSSTATAPQPDTPTRGAVVESDKPLKSSLANAASKSMTIGDVKRHVKDADAIRSEVEAAVDEETLRDLYESKKDVEIKEEGKTHVNIVFIGHVDAGKSTMGGNILYLTGMVDKRTMEKLEKEAKDAGKESWYLSWALDSTIQERAKGKTVEIGRAYFETDKRRYTILDAPGHKTYVPAMISGASQADIAILVISARKGEFETGFERGGQTREHAMLVKTTGVSKLIVVINKMDDITVEWDKSRYDEIINKLTPFLKLTGFNPNKDVTYIPVSGYTGANIKDRVSKDKCSWFDGPSLLEFLDEVQLTDRKYNSPLMMPISEKYKDMGAVVVGKLESGKVSKGDTVLMMPNKSTVEVSAIYNEMEDEVQRALCGDNVRIRLKGIEDEDIMCGFVLTDASKPIHTVSRFEAQLAILDSKNIICAGYGAVMHVHTLAEECTLIGLLHYYDKKTGKKSRRPPQFAKKGMKIVALIETAAPICVETFKDHPQLGRFTLRDEGKTIAIGKITKLITDGSVTTTTTTATGVAQDEANLSNGVGRVNLNAPSGGT
ncbi:P-loop containing nucleoside triphosphate hydrolase protein [Phakopsora pachyrhizi]|uniref:Eukaryotic peptide chain release factor GTP-binding subunit n=1 Tax=Phakopsora pachyrhizi TaxID=170000 RepID=A0AAV0ALB6_PHAPC|nr:P-loop containing nucleoside triphosphate hydrolase protein [Phakopsora pachyrhizi]CAH7667794.1 P-loop containing nucleoside triphosphate hydrolase protein [Phakopsora pachyrhizi]